MLALHEEVLKSVPPPFQVPEGYVFDNMFYKWDVRSHASLPCYCAFRFSACLPAGSNLCCAVP